MMPPVRVFAGYEEAEAIGFHVFCHSLIRRASIPISITPLASQGLPKGSNSFTLSRFLVPYLCGFKGWAIFADASDMMMEADIAELWAMRAPTMAVQVVKRAEYKTRHPVKYRGTKLQGPNRDYERKNWASLMLINCEHRAWVGVTPERIAAKPVLDWLQLRHIPDDQIGELPPEWNCLIDEGHESEGAKILHWTAGIPAFPMYRSAPGARDWWAEHSLMTAAERA